jgi:predicted ATP-grasp superfamily ATP-dependent carboligase
VDVLIVGAGARAAAWSALRAGLRPAAADLFADRDLEAVAESVRLDTGRFPDGLLDAAGSWPARPWFYTGALENRPDLIERLARRAPLLGNDAATVRAVRDPIAVAGALRAAGIPAPEVRLGDPAGLGRDGSWLRKPLASAGGIGIEPLAPGAPATELGCYYQRRIDGAPLSAVFLGRRSGATLAGVTRQLLGRPGAEFAYRGNLAPWLVDEDVAGRVKAVGDRIASHFGLVGLFGVDFQLTGDGLVWPVEVNPRYTAGVEVLELAFRRALLAEHVEACAGRPQPRRGPGQLPGRFVAKEVLFAARELVFEEDVRTVVGARAPDLFRVPRIADVPRRGTRIAVGEPVLTVFARGKTPGDTLRRLALKRAAWERRIGR